MQEMKNTQWISKERKSDKTSATVIQFVSQEKITKARQELISAGFNDTAFSDSELIHVIREQEVKDANSIVSFIVDFIMKKKCIVTGAQAVAYLSNSLHDTSENRYRLIGELDSDQGGEYFLIVANKAEEERKIDTIYKVYVNGSIKEMWMER